MTKTKTKGKAPASWARSASLTDRCPVCKRELGQHVGRDGRSCPPSPFPHVERDQLTLPVPRPRRPGRRSPRAAPSTPPNVAIEAFSVPGDGNNAVSYQLKHIRCGKERCRRCKAGEGHGPYWYASTSRNGRTLTTYVGRELPDAVRALRA